MFQYTCQQLREKLNELKELKAGFNVLLGEAKTLADVSEVKKAQAKFESELESVPLFSFINKFREQYQGRLNTLERFGICSKERPFIVDINGQRHAFPSFKEIVVGLNFEVIGKIRKMKEPRLLLTPIGMSLKSLIDHVNTTYIFDDGLDSRYGKIVDRNRIYYFPENFHHDDHKGKNKKQVIQERGGWLVSVVDREPQEIIDSFATDLEEKFQSVFQNKLKQGLRGMTYEEYLLFALEMAKEGYLLDENSTTILDGIILSGKADLKLTGNIGGDYSIKLDRFRLPQAEMQGFSLLYRSVVDIIIKSK